MSQAAKLYAIAGTALCIVFCGLLPSFPKTAVMIATYQSIDRSHKSDRLKGSAIHWLRKFDFQDKCDLAIDTENLSAQQICDLILNSVVKVKKR